MRTRHKVAILVAAAWLVWGCANNPPPTLSPQAKVAWYGTTVIHDLDLLRDIAQDGNATVPPLISTATARKVTVWHEASITTVHAAPAGWQSTVQTGLDELVKGLPPNEAATFAPYIRLIQTILREAL